MQHRGIRFAVVLGALGLASGMGIGRFAFTPLLPLMQAQTGLSLQHGSWLASANYLGYLIGALLCFAMNPQPGAAARTGLAGVAALTLAMGMADSLYWWLALRGLAGIASALVLVGVSGWAMALLAQHGRPDLSGWVFAGVGLGMGIAGLVGLASGVWGVSAPITWMVLGAVSACTALLAWRALGLGAETALREGIAAVAPAVLPARAWKLVACYGAFGYGYIIPATFLPALGRQLAPDPAVFGWAWPAFGAAAAVSTIAASRWFRNIAPARTLGGGMIVMAIGVVAPVQEASLFMVMISALCVGGTFMVVTMAGIHAARAAVPQASAPKAIAAMTTAFAAGQLVGPLTVQSGSVASSLMLPSIAAAALLLLSAATLLYRHREAGSVSPVPRNCR